MHIPVLLKEVLETLNPKPGEFFIDGTIDGGGHAIAVLERIMPGGKFLGLDWDEAMLKIAKSKITPNPKIFLINANYANMHDILERNNFGKADGLLLDLGFSTEQLENSGRGFSYQKNEPLLLNYSADADITAEKVINSFSEKRVADIIRQYGEERFAGRIAREIVRTRSRKPIKTTVDLVDVVKKSTPKNYERGRLHPAARTFQALRIYVNRELENLEKVLGFLPSVMKKGGRAAVIAFHSLEDRIVKGHLKDLAQKKMADGIPKKPIRPSLEEIIGNPRSRSAKLRVVRFV